MDSGAIIDAVRGVLTGDLGSVRTIAAGTFVDGVPASMIDDQARRLRVSEKPSFDIELDPPGTTPAVGPIDASLTIASARVKVTLTYGLTPTADAADGTGRRAVRAAASDDAWAVMQALTWNNNVSVDTSANPTGLINGALLNPERPLVRREDWTAGVYVVELAFTALVLDSLSVS